MNVPAPLLVSAMAPVICALLIVFTGPAVTVKSEPPKLKSVVLLMVSVAAIVLVTITLLKDATVLVKPASVWSLPARSY